MRKAHFSKNPLAFLCVVITTCFFTILVLSVIRLPETPPVAGGKLGHRKIQKNLSEIQELGYFGKMMIDMLPEDLVFTAFVPSDRAFRRDLGLKPNEKSRVTDGRAEVEEADDNTYAVVSRVLGFSVVPYKVDEGDVAEGETASYDSLGGFRLNIWKKKNGGLVVNGVEAEQMALKRGKMVVHVMNGVVMDALFAQSFGSSDSLQDEEN